MVIRQHLIRFSDRWKRHVQPEGAIEPTAAAELDAGDAIDARELSLRILAHLPPRTARAVWLVMAEGLSLREAGDRLGISKERVRQIVSVAADRARERFADWT
jgi:RNA polymerase sigma factor (sigma-70 family)